MRHSHPEAGPPWTSAPRARWPATVGAVGAVGTVRAIGLAMALLGAASLSADTADADPAKARGQPAQPIVGVIELYTSQGCSSCPPADALLKAYAERPDVLALTLPVDYWDYLGWKDTLGSPRYSERQRNYARARGDGQVYTPQVVVNGLAHAVGSARGAIDAALMLTESDVRASRVPIELMTEGSSLVIEAGAAPAAALYTEATVWLAAVQTSVTVEIGRGENTGRRVTYTNVVRDLTPVGTWTGKPLRIELPRSAVMRKDLEKIAVLLQHGKAGPVIGAAVTGLW